MQDGDTVRIGGRDWRCISGYGHAPEHIALYCEALNVLISGDMMLPRISTNVSVYDVRAGGQPAARSSSTRIDKFAGAARRHAGAALARQAVPRPARAHPPAARAPPRPAGRGGGSLRRSAAQSAADVLPVLFKRKLDLHQTTFAMGESVAHLHALWFAGKLSRSLGEDGIYRFAPA